MWISLCLDTAILMQRAFGEAALYARIKGTKTILA